MPEALAASSDHDFTVSSPRPPRRPRAKAAKAAPDGLAKRGLAFAARYPLEILISLALASAGGAITWNALALQTAQHPAPLFGRAKGEGPAPLPPARPSLAAPAAPAPAAPAPAPLPVVATAPTLPPAPATPARPAARDGIGDLIRTGEPPASAPAARPAPPARPAPAPVAVAPPRDITSSVASAPPAPARSGIGDLIRLGDPAPIPPAFVGKPEVNRVAAAQRALAKLGYGAMKVDGVMGSGTKQAIERFERDRRLPVTGDLGPRTARELASASGLPVD
ncbi:MAG TPA: peptidoglycan-binding domain-containing protein [Microvirga sp.]